MGIDIKSAIVGGIIAFFGYFILALLGFDILNYLDNPDNTEKELCRAFPQKCLPRVVTYKDLVAQFRFTYEPKRWHWQEYQLSNGLEVIQLTLQDMPKPSSVAVKLIVEEMPRDTDVTQYIQAINATDLARFEPKAKQLKISQIQTASNTDENFDFSWQYEALVEQEKLYFIHHGFFHDGYLIHMIYRANQTDYNNSSALIYTLSDTLEKLP
jgi:hypothetical protein